MQRRPDCFVQGCRIVLLLLIAAQFGLSLGSEQEQLHDAGLKGLVLVRGGTFQMGDVWGDGPWAMREVPVHEVQVDNFLLAQYEVTVAEFARFVVATGYKTVAERAAGTRTNRGFLKDGRQFYPLSILLYRPFRLRFR